MTQENSEATNEGYSSEELSGFRETLSKIDEGSLPSSSLDELPLDILDQVSAGEGQIFDVEDSGLSDDNNPQESTTSATEPEPESLDLKYKRKADEANTWKQKYESLERKAEATLDFELKLQDPEFRKKYFEEKGYMSSEELEEIDLTVPLDEDGEPDFYNEDYLRNMNKALVQYNKDRKARAEQERQSTQQTLRQKEIERTFSEIESLQGKYEHLKTEKSFKELDTEFIEFKRKLGNDLGRYMEDESFRAAKEQEGVVAPSELDKYLTLLDLNSRKSKYPSLEAAYRDSSFFDEHLNSISQPKETKPSFDVLGTKELKEEFGTMGQGQSGGGVEGNEAEDIAFMERWAGREHEMTPADEKQYDAIIARMDAKYGGI